MKRTSFIFACFVFFCFNASAQAFKKTLPDFPCDESRMKHSHGLFSTKGISPNTAFLLADMMKKEANPAAMTEQQLIKKYCLHKKGNMLYANSFILAGDGFSMSDLKSYGVLPGSKSGKVYTGLVPVDRIREVANVSSVAYLDIGHRGVLALDSTRSATQVNQVHQGLPPLPMPYKGAGVVVADIDMGFDYTHPNFYDSTGVNNYRIKRVWQQLDNTGTPPAGFSYGTELITQTAILNAHTDDSTGTHGTHVTGIAAGAGGYPNSPYTGVAPESDIVLVATDLLDSHVADAISYVQQYAASVNKPCVINMSFGSQKGPHDGTSLPDLYNNGMVGPGKLLVSAAGNSGEQPLYLGHYFSGADSLLVTFLTFNIGDMPHIGDNYPHIVGAGPGVVDMWGEVNENFEVALAILNLYTNQFEDQTDFHPANIDSMYIDSLTGSNNVAVQYMISTGIQQNNKPEVFFGIDNSKEPDGNRIVALIVKGHNASVNMWGVGYPIPGLGLPNYITFSDLGFGIPVQGGSTDHTVGDGGPSGDSVITVGAYTSKNEWTALDNSNQLAIAYAPAGDIAPFSSKGPTADGRTKPDITAPGNVIVSSVNSYNAYYNASNTDVVDGVITGNHTWYYAIDQGTSMAAPVVTGILALWMQQNPQLTRAQALEMMKSTAITDTYTGSIPAAGNNTWGWGKVNAFDGLAGSLSVAAITHTVTSINVYPNPVTNQLTISFEKVTAAPADMVLYDLTGKAVYKKHLAAVSSGTVEQINTNPFPTGVYTLKITDGTETVSYKIVKQ